MYLNVGLNGREKDCVNSSNIDYIPDGNLINSGSLFNISNLTLKKVEAVMYII